MGKVVTDPAQVEHLAEKREDENWAFRGWIKCEFGYGDERLMSVVRDLTSAITAEIDCTRCANCCRTLPVILEQGDIERLVAALGMSVGEIQDAFLEYDEDRGGRWLLPAPCPLLEGNLCRVYEARPLSCREYPHLHNDFCAASISRIGSTFVCPIVYNVVEELKIALHWRHPRRRRGRM